jgi:hypothetical protein
MLRVATEVLGCRGMGMSIGTRKYSWAAIWSSVGRWLGSGWRMSRIRSLAASGMNILSGKVYELALMRLYLCRMSGQSKENCKRCTCQYARCLHIACLEGRLANEHGVQDYAHTPHINLVAVSSLPQNLRSNIVRRPAQRALAFTIKSNLASQSKVSNFEIMPRCEEQVAELEVAVNYVL